MRTIKTTNFATYSFAQEFQWRLKYVVLGGDAGPEKSSVIVIKTTPVRRDEMAGREVLDARRYSLLVR